MGSPCTYLYGLVQSPQVRDLCRHVSSSPKPHVDSGALAASQAQRGHCQEQRGRFKWLQAVQVTQSVVTGAGKQDVEQQQDMAWQFKQEGVQEGTDTLLAPEVSSPRGDCFFLCPT